MAPMDSARPARTLRRQVPWAVWAAAAAMTALAWAAGRTISMVEILLLAAFLPFMDRPRGKALVIYDGECGFCNRVRKWLERLDFARSFQWIPFQAPAAQELGIPREAFEARMHLLAGERVWTGFAAFRVMALFSPAAYVAVLALLLPASWLGFANWVMAALLALFAPFLTPVGEAVYDWVARNRHRIPPRSCKTLALAAALLAAPAAAEVVIVHDEEKPMAVLAAFLQKNGQNVQVLDQAGFRSRKSSRPPDAIVMYIHQQIEPEVEQAMIAYTRAGGRLVLLHHGIASAKMRSPQWLPFHGVRLMPRDSLEYPWRVAWGDVQLVNLRPGHYLTSHNVKWDRTVAYTPSDGPSTEQQLPAIELPDTEAYLNQLFTDGRAKTVLLGLKCRAEGMLHMQDRAGWTMPAGKGHIVYFQQGHHPRDFEHPSFSQMILNSLRWTPGRE